MVKLQRVAGFAALGTVVGGAALSGYGLLMGMSWAEPVFTLIIGGMMGIVSGLFASSSEKITFEQPANYKAKIHITAGEE